MRVKKDYKLASPYLSAIEALRVDLHTVKTNEPINRKEGNVGQANLERDNAKSYRMAIRTLSKQ